MPEVINGTQTAIVRASHVSKIYSRGAEPVRAVDDVSFDIMPGEFVAIVGHSGSGKTTLLQLIGGMDKPTSGNILIYGVEIENMPDRQLTHFRRTKLGFVFQHFGLLNALTVRENIELAGLGSRKEVQDRATLLLEQTGMVHRDNHRPTQLSGGEMQRVAIARALINRPKIVLADEPTGNLDTDNSQKVLQILQEQNALGQTLVIVTHNEQIAALAHRKIKMADGKIVAI